MAYWKRGINDVFSLWHIDKEEINTLTVILIIIIIIIIIIIVIIIIIIARILKFKSA